MVYNDYKGIITGFERDIAIHFMKIFCKLLIEDAKDGILWSSFAPSFKQALQPPRVGFRLRGIS